MDYKTVPPITPDELAFLAAVDAERDARWQREAREASRPRKDWYAQAADDAGVPMFGEI